MTPVTVEELSAELFQSRTSLFKGSKEHFEQTPLELQRSVRMDRVRQLLQDPARRASQGLSGIGDTAGSMGFTSRSGVTDSLAKINSPLKQPNSTEISSSLTAVTTPKAPSITPI
jgi:AraC-like DNA-binding protein